MVLQIRGDCWPTGYDGCYPFGYDLGGPCRYKYCGPCPFATHGAPIFDICTYPSFC